MTKLAAILFTAVTLTACGSSSPCEKAIAKVEKLSGISIDGDMRKEAIAQCEKEPKEQLDCVLKADTMEDLMKCK